jgi:UDP-3-O-[3-hydroxymyristoyl] glucosamine N-acyltransferase
MSLVNQSITEPGVYSSGTGLSDTASWRKNIVRFRQLDDFWKRLSALEALEALEAHEAPDEPNTEKKK